MEQHFVLTVRCVYNPTDLFLSKPALLLVGNRGQRRVPLAGSLVVLLRVPVHDGPEQLPQVVNGLRFQAPTLQNRNPFIDGSGLDLFESHHAKEGTQILRNEPRSRVLTALLQLRKPLCFPRLSQVSEGCGRSQRPFQVSRGVDALGCNDVHELAPRLGSRTCAMLVQAQVVPWWGTGRPAEFSPSGSNPSRAPQPAGG